MGKLKGSMQPTGWPLTSKQEIKQVSLHLVLHSGLGCEVDSIHGCNRPSISSPRNPINIRISHSGSKAQYEGDTRNQWFVDVCRILMFMWPLGSPFIPDPYGSSDAPTPTAATVQEQSSNSTSVHSPCSGPWPEQLPQVC